MTVQGEAAQAGEWTRREVSGLEAGCEFDCGHRQRGTGVPWARRGALWQRFLQKWKASLTLRKKVDGLSDLAQRQFTVHKSHARDIPTNPERFAVSVEGGKSMDVVWTVSNLYPRQRQISA